MTRAWIEADSGLRAAITTAVDQIDVHLQDSPASKGESRSEGRRILLLSPLGILYQVEPENQTVVVLRMWVFRQSRR